MSDLPDEVYWEIYKWADSRQIETWHQCSFQTQSLITEDLISQNIKHRFGIQLNSRDAQILILRLLEQNIVVNANLVLMDRKKNLKILGKILLTPAHTVKDLLRIIKNKTGQICNIEYRSAISYEKFTHEGRYHDRSGEGSANYANIKGEKSMRVDHTIFSMDENLDVYKKNYDRVYRELEILLSFELKWIIPNTFPSNLEIVVTTQQPSPQISQILNKLL